jgi:hypothetical protein
MLGSLRRLCADVNRCELRPEVRPLVEVRSLSFSGTTPRAGEMGTATYLPGRLAQRVDGRYLTLRSRCACTARASTRRRINHPSIIAELARAC